MSHEAPKFSGEDLSVYMEMLKGIKPDANKEVLTRAARVLSVMEAKGNIPGQSEAEKALADAAAEEENKQGAGAGHKVIADSFVAGDKGDIDPQELREAA